MRLDDRPVESPCVRQCTLDDRDICLGCRRMLDEIIEWGRASDARKREILMASLARQPERRHS